VTNTLILLGRITDAHGIRGAVKIKSFTTDPKAIASYGTLQTGDGRSVDILRMKLANDVFIADLKDIKDRNAAETLKGQDLLIARDKLPAADESEIYLVDLVGQSAVHDGSILGSIVGIQNFGAGDLLEIDTGAKDTLLVPAVFLRMRNDVVDLELPGGFLDLDVKKED
jgi:16S rRNA processing protein RimM